MLLPNVLCVFFSRLGEKKERHLTQLLSQKITVSITLSLAKIIISVVMTKKNGDKLKKLNKSA